MAPLTTAVSRFQRFSQQCLHYSAAHFCLKHDGGRQDSATATTCVYVYSMSPSLRTCQVRQASDVAPFTLQESCGEERGLAMLMRGYALRSAGVRMPAKARTGVLPCPLQWGGCVCA